MSSIPTFRSLGKKNLSVKPAAGGQLLVLTSWREANDGIWSNDIVRPLSRCLHFKHEVLLRIVKIQAVIFIPRQVFPDWVDDWSQMDAIVLVNSLASQNQASTRSVHTFPPV